MATAATPEKIKIRLHYWNVQGRVQAVRYMLEDVAAKYPNVDYQEDVELMEKMGETWPARKEDKTISGAFGNLPVLHWNDTQMICQTLPIAQFIARKFDLYGKAKWFDDDPIVFHGLIDGVVSCAYTDVIFGIFMILYNQVDLDDPNHMYALLVKKVAVDLKMLNDLLKESSTMYFYDQDDPTIADYFVFYAFTMAKDLHSALLPANDDSQALYKLEQTMRARPALSKYFHDNRLYNRLSGSPTEELYRATLMKKK